MTPFRITAACRGMTRTLIVLILVLPAVVSGQIQSITTSLDYSFALSKRLNVQSAPAIGGGVEIRLGLYENISLGVTGGYASYAIDQPDELNQWNWNFWNERYYLKIQSDLRADPNLSANIDAVQSMSVIPVMLSIIYGYAAGENLTIAPKVAGGVSFFTRKLYADETWTKKFPAAGYTLTYNLRNFAPDKKGNVFVGALGCDIDYRFSGDVSLAASVQYRKYVSTSSGFDVFPFGDECLFKLGLTFLY